MRPIGPSAAEMGPMSGQEARARVGATGGDALAFALRRVVG
jgi:hypothetical protein